MLLYIKCWLSEHRVAFLCLGFSWIERLIFVILYFITIYNLTVFNLIFDSCNFIVGFYWAFNFIVDFSNVEWRHAWLVIICIPLEILKTAQISQCVLYHNIIPVLFCSAEMVAICGRLPPSARAPPTGGAVPLATVPSVHELYFIPGLGRNVNCQNHSDESAGRSTFSLKF